jgi:hypothetical protein
MGHFASRITSLFRWCSNNIGSLYLVHKRDEEPSSSARDTCPEGNNPNFEDDNEGGGIDQTPREYRELMIPGEDFQWLQLLKK